MKETIKLGLTLLIITAVAAGILALTNETTGPIIAEREREKAFGAFLELFPEGDDFVEIDEDLLAEIQSTNTTVTGVLEAKSGEEIIGYAFQVAAGGYGGDINSIIGINVDDTIAGVRVGSHAETPDIGDKIEDASFTDTFIGKTTAGELVAVGSPSAENEVQAISGSTISVFGVITGANDANDAYNRYFTDNEVEPVVEETEEEKQERLLSEIFADADEFTPAEHSEEVDEVLEAKSGGELLGYVFMTSSKGYGDSPIPVMTGINLDGTIVGIRVGSNSETPGLGTKIEEADFTDSFVGKGTDSELTAVGAPSAENEVQMISGATVSVKGVMSGVNNAREAFINLISQ